MISTTKGLSSTSAHRVGQGMALFGLFMFLDFQSSLAQVSPAEIINPQLRTLEETYLKKLTTINGAVAGMKFPFPFFLSRHVGLAPKEQLAADKRGLEFVKFNGRTVMKLTGNYNAAFNADQLTSNQRSSKVFNEVILPILRLLPGYFSPNESFDAFGFEISYHTRRGGREYEFEGKEILVIVIDKADLLRFLNAHSDSDRQEVLNQSEIYLNGKDFGLALGQHDPIDIEALDRSNRNPILLASAQKAKAVTNEGLPSTLITKPPQPLPQPKSEISVNPVGVESHPTSGSPTITPVEVERLQTKYQTQLDELATEGVAKHHFVKYAPPSFGVFQDRVYLQVTLKNPTKFEKDTTSIYKRAAQSLDLFLAPQLKAILAKVPNGQGFEGLEIAVLNELTFKSSSSSEAIEFICPLKLLRQFANAEITNQELINQSIVLVNEVRIALNLQLAE
jgi:hypothetical protein